MLKRLGMGAVALMVMLPKLAYACACGCGLFDVGTGSMLPTGQGGSVWLEYDYLNQTINMNGTHRSPEENNDDKALQTNFITFGGQYMFNRSWGVETTVPYVDRHFTTVDEDSGDLASYRHADFGDVKLKGVYTGLSDDMSTGLTFGLKLPTGSYNHTGFDRDTDIGTGSTDLLLGAYQLGAVPFVDNYKWFVNGQWQHAVMMQNNYRPGDDYNLALGSYYDGFNWGKAGKLTPQLQVIGSYRHHDTGENASTTGSGYTRAVIAPGLEYAVESVKLYGDIETPIYNNVNGDQLVSPLMFKFVVAYNF